MALRSVIGNCFQTLTSHFHGQLGKEPGGCFDARCSRFFNSVSPEVLLKRVHPQPLQMERMKTPPSLMMRLLSKAPSSGCLSTAGSEMPIRRVCLFMFKNPDCRQVRLRAAHQPAGLQFFQARFRDRRLPGASRPGAVGRHPTQLPQCPAARVRRLTYADPAGTYVDDFGGNHFVRSGSTRRRISLARWMRLSGLRWTVHASCRTGQAGAGFFSDMEANLS